MNTDIKKPIIKIGQTYLDFNQIIGIIIALSIVLFAIGQLTNIGGTINNPPSDLRLLFDDAKYKHLSSEEKRDFWKNSLYELAIQEFESDDLMLDASGDEELISFISLGINKLTDEELTSKEVYIEVKENFIQIISSIKKVVIQENNSIVSKSWIQKIREKFHLWPFF